jgi:hypothetical protein
LVQHVRKACDIHLILASPDIKFVETSDLCAARVYTDASNFAGFNGDELHDIDRFKWRGRVIGGHEKELVVPQKKGLQPY